MAERLGVGLIRVSTDAQAESDRASIPAQRETIRQIAVQVALRHKRVLRRQRRRGLHKLARVLILTGMFYAGWIVLITL